MNGNELVRSKCTECVGIIVACAKPMGPHVGAAIRSPSPISSSSLVVVKPSWPSFECESSSGSDESLLDDV